MNLKNTEGFTLIELLVVISIIGLLASVVLVSLNSARSKARDTKRKADISQLQKALELYLNNNNSNVYPNGGTVTNADTGYDIQNLSSFLVPTYLSKIPNDPRYPGAANYQYVWTNGGADYGLYIPFGNDGNLTTCKFRTAGGASGWWSVADCNY
jgi:type II secretion system protein G